MAKPIVVPTQFANANIATGAQLDGDINVLAAAINDPNTYTNYLVDSGSTPNAYVVAFTGASVITSYTAGLAVTMFTARANTGAATIVVNGLAPINVLNPDDSPLVAGQIPANSVVQLVFDGTDFQLETFVYSAFQAAVPSINFIQKEFYNFGI